MKYFKCCFKEDDTNFHPQIKELNIRKKSANDRKTSIFQTNIYVQNLFHEKIDKELKLNNFIESSIFKKHSNVLDRQKTVIQNLNNEIKPHWTKKDIIRCYFCNGEKCKHENWKNNKDCAIKGLHSDYISKDIIASQRPSRTLIEEFNMISSFKQNNIGLIVNLQREGEHPYCGPNKGLEKISGFTYDPHVFISEDIKVKLSGWKDMSVPDSMNFMLDIVKEMTMTIKEDKKKVLVHCHAGYGRTGIVIVCYFIFNTNTALDEIISRIRLKRSGCVQKSSQYEYCKKFKEYIDKCRPIFSFNEINIELFMKYQNDLLYGEEKSKYEFIPKIISLTLERIIDLLDEGKVVKEDIYKYMYQPEWSDENEAELLKMKTNINNGNWEYITDDISILSQMLYDWLEDNINFIINPEKIINIFDEKGLGFLIEEHVNNSNKFSSDNRKTLIDNIKLSLRSIESETLSCIAHFINKIKSDDEDFVKVFNRIAYLIIGNNHNNIRIKCTHKLVQLIKLFCIVLENDVVDEVTVLKKTQFSAYANRRKLTEHNFKKILFKDISNDNTNIENQNIVSNSFEKNVYELYKVLDEIYKSKQIVKTEILLSKLNLENIYLQMKNLQDITLGNSPIIRLNSMAECSETSNKIKDIKSPRSNCIRSPNIIEPIKENKKLRSDNNIEFVRKVSILDYNAYSSSDDLTE